MYRGPERSITAEEVLKALAALFAHRGEPAFIRSDNGPEFIAKAVKQWLDMRGVKTLYTTLSQALRGRTPTQRRS